MTSLIPYAVSCVNRTLTAPLRQILTKCGKINHVYEVLCAKQTRKIWCNYIYALHRYRNFCLETFYSDSPGITTPKLRLSLTTDA